MRLGSDNDDDEYNPEKTEYLEDNISSRHNEKSLLFRKLTLPPSVGGRGN